MDQEEPHVEEQPQQMPAENKTESEEMEVGPCGGGCVPVSSRVGLAVFLLCFGR